VVDALEVPSTAGILAASWWRSSEGYPDEIRRLPALPDPRRALALIAAGDRHFFLTQAGECPWRSQDPATTAAVATPRAAVIRWHSQGSRIPLPSSSTSDDAVKPAVSASDLVPGQSASASGNEPAAAHWMHWPDRGLKLSSPAVLLHLLATAAAAIRLGPHMLVLDHDVLAIPLFGETPTAEASPRTRSAPAFGFSRNHG
jgi:hypothetical protein